jgi:uncharacterized protein (DUF983 family)
MRGGNEPEQTNSADPPRCFHPFTVLVIVNIVLNFVATGSEQLTLWVGVLTLVPLVLLMLTGLYPLT